MAKITKWPIVKKILDTFNKRKTLRCNLMVTILTDLHISSVYRSCCAVTKASLTSRRNVRPGYREKSADLQGALKLHLQFYNRISRSHRPCNEN